MECNPLGDHKTLDERCVKAGVHAYPTWMINGQKHEGVLPLDPGIRRVAIIGPNADRAVIMGGGSATVTPAYRTTPLDAPRSTVSCSLIAAFSSGESLARN